MKKIYSLVVAAAATLSINAQQLPNYGFDNWKGTCGSTEAFSSATSYENRQRPGDEPTSWNGSSVNQKVSGVTKQQELVYKTTEDGNNSVQLKNTYVGVNLGITKIGSTAPGYITLGTPWVYAVTNLNKCDGGTYGGESFTYRPDAIRGKYKRTDSNAEDSHIIFYSWTGTFKSKVGDKTSPQTVRDNVDRAILARDNANATSESNGTLIASADYTFRSTGSGYQQIEVPLQYHSSQAPQMYNVVISAADYWTRSNMLENTELYVDDVELLYYSRLASLSVNGTPVSGFDSNTYSYTVNTTMPSESAFAYTCLGNSGSGRATIALDKENAVATITVTNSNGTNVADFDGKSSHTYTIQFNKSASNNYGGTVYTGSLVIDMMGNGDILEENGRGEVHIISNADGTCTFVLPNFEIDLGNGPMPLGDIIVENVSTTVKGNTTEYSGYVEGMELAEGAIVANVTLTGSSDGAKASMIINVGWIYYDEYENTTVEIPIDVTFNGDIDLAGINEIGTDNDFNAPVEYYNIKGMRVSQENLAPGIYIRRQGKTIEKVIVK